MRSTSVPNPRQAKTTGSRASGQAPEGAPAYLAAPGARAGTIIPRDVVAWLQSLQLSRPVKVPRRDLANGFSVAEICSHYWPTQVSMHSYVNRLGSQNKASNWALLQKVFAKQGAPLSDKVVDGMTSGKPHYADVFLTQLYSLLTGKVVRLTALPLDDLPEPVKSVDPFEPTSMSLAAAAHTDSLHSNYTYPSHSLAGGLGDDTKDSNRRREEAPTKSAAAALAELSGTATRVAELAGASTGDGAGGAADSPNPAAAPRTSRPMEQMAGPASLRTRRHSSVGGAVVGDAGGGDHFLVDVKVRAANRSTTVVDPSSAQPRGQPLGYATAERAGGAHRTSLPSSSNDAASTSTSPSTAVTGTDNARTVPAITGTAATQHVEQVIRQAAERLHCVWSVPLRGACPSALYFVQHAQEMEAAVQSGVWGALLSSLPDLAQLVRGDSAALPSLTVLFMSAGAEGTAGATTSRAVNFLSALLAQLASLDPYHALASLQSGVLAVPVVRQWLSVAQFTEAEQCAALVCAVVSPDRPTAAALLGDLLSSVYETTVGHAGATRGMVVFGMILRAVAVRLARTSPAQRAQQAVSAAQASSTTTCGGGGSAAIGQTGRPTTSPGSMARGGKEDVLHAAVLHVLDFNTVAALSASDSAVRLVGFSLAVTATRLGAPLSTALHTHARLLFPALATVADSEDALAGLSWQRLLPATDDPAMHVVRAQWLHAVQMRLAAAEDSSPGDDYTDAPAEGRAATWTAAVVRTIIAALCGYVRAPGGHVKAKALVTYELACTLTALSPVSPSSTGATGADVRDTVADAIMLFLESRAPADVIAAATGLEAGLLFPPDASTTDARLSATRGVDVHSGLVWSHALLGPLCVARLCACSAPLFLCEAASRLADCARTLTETRKEAIRRLTARASILAKEGNVSASTRLRVMWLYLLTVGYSGAAQQAHRALPVHAHQLTATEVARRWEHVLQDAYVDFLLILSTEELIQRQAGTAATAASASSSTTGVAKRPLTPAQEVVIALAGHVRAVVRQWFVDLSPSLGGGGGAEAGSDDLDAQAITWYHRLFGEAEGN